MTLKDLIHPTSAFMRMALGAGALVCGDLRWIPDAIRPELAVALGRVSAALGVDSKDARELQRCAKGSATGHAPVAGPKRSIGGRYWVRTSDLTDVNRAL